MKLSARSFSSERSKVNLEAFAHLNSPVACKKDLSRIFYFSYPVFADHRIQQRGSQGSGEVMISFTPVETGISKLPVFLSGCRNIDIQAFKQSLTCGR